MFFYFSLLTVVGILSYFEILGITDKQRKLFFLITCLVLFFLSFVRWETGTDWDEYISMFERYSWENTEMSEPLFAFLSLVSKDLFSYYTFFLLIQAIIIFYFQSKSISDYSVYPMMSLFILVGMYIGNICFVRQTIAVSLTFYSIRYIVSRNFRMFLLFLLLAVGFHYTAVVFLPAWWICNREFSRRKIMLCTFASLFLSSFFLLILTNLGEATGAIIQNKIMSYTGEGAADESYVSPFMAVLKTILNRVVFYFLGFYLYDKISEEYPYFRIFFYLFCFGTILCFVTLPLSNILGRLCRYYDISQIILLPYFFAYLSSNFRKVLCFFFLFAVMALKLYINVMTYEELFIPFKFLPLLYE